MSDGETLAKVLKQLAQLVQGLSRDELAAIQAGRLKLAFVPGPAHDNEGTRSPRAKRDATPLVAALQGALTREEAFGHLDEWNLSNAELREVARALGAAVRKDDTNERLRDKVVESSVGYRLRSDAIRGKQP